MGNIQNLINYIPNFLKIGITIGVFIALIKGGNWKAVLGLLFAFMVALLVITDDEMLKISSGVIKGFVKFVGSFFSLS